MYVPMYVGAAGEAAVQMSQTGKGFIHCCFARGAERFVMKSSQSIMVATAWGIVV